MHTHQLNLDNNENSQFIQYNEHSVFLDLAMSNLKPK